MSISLSEYFYAIWIYNVCDTCKSKLNQQINGSLSTMNDAQCYSIAYLGNFVSTPNFKLTFVLISITYYIIKHLILQ